MAKITLDDIGTDSFQAIARYNANQALIEAALEKTLSRDGTAPNAMNAPLDMNSNQILNLPSPTNTAHAATKGYVDGVVNALLAGVAPGALDYEAADDQVRADLTTSINAVADDLEANITAVTTLTARVTTAESDINAVEASVTSESTARATADSALSARLDVVEASIESPNTLLVARVEDLEEAVVDLETNSATASSVTTLAARVTTAEGNITTNAAAITSEATARASADSALSTRLDSVEALVDSGSTNIAARVTSLELASADLEATKAEASTVTTLTSTVNGINSTVTSQGTAIASLDGKLTASYGLTVDGNGRIASMKLLSNGSTSEVAFTADTFKIFNGTSNQAIFTASGGSVRINGNLVVNGTISTAALADVGGTVATGLIANYYETNTDPGSVANGSLWFKPNTSELFIRRSGAWGKIANITTTSGLNVSANQGGASADRLGAGTVTLTGFTISVSGGTGPYYYDYIPAIGITKGGTDTNPTFSCVLGVGERFEGGCEVRVTDSSNGKVGILNLFPLRFREFTSDPWE